MPQSLQARILFPVDSPPIEHGVVTIDGERLVAVGTSAASNGRVRDLGEVALLPGLVNTHTHLEFSHRGRPLGRAGMPLADWLRLVLAERRRRGDQVADAIAAGLSESLAAGVTAIGEIATADVAAYLPAPAVDFTLLAEVVGFSRARAASSLTAIADRLDAMQAVIADRIGAIRPASRRRRRSDPHRHGQWHTVGGLVDETRLGISPHAPYSVSPTLVDELVALARRRNMPIAMHLAESQDELELLSDGMGPLRELLEERSMWDASAIPRGSRPLDYLTRLADAPRAMVVHGNFLDDQERAFLAAHADRMSLVYCPRTHAYFAHPPYPLAQALAAGVHVVLGTDSRASNPDLSILSEMRYVAATHPEVDPHTVLRMATLGAAEALRRANDLGSLTPGKLANLVAIPLPEGPAGTQDDLLNALLAAERSPIATWLRGHQVHGTSD